MSASLRTRLAQAFSKVATAKGIKLGRLRFALADAALDVFDDEAAERMVADMMERTRVRSIDFRNGVDMDLDGARELTAAFVAAARTMLVGAENYSETRVEIEVKVAESPERYSLVVQRVGKLTPHEARRIAEAERDQLRLELAAARGAVAPPVVGD